MIRAGSDSPSEKLLCAVLFFEHVTEARGLRLCPNFPHTRGTAKCLVKAAWCVSIVYKHI